MNKTNRSKQNGVTVDAPWIALPLPFLRSTACANLSPHAAKLFIDCLASLNGNWEGNGDISLTWKLMKRRGWPSRTSLNAAITELKEARLLVLTRQGSRPSCSLFALTLHPIHCDFRKLDVTRNFYSRHDYKRTEQLAAPPTDEHRAVWNRVRKSKTVAPPGNKNPENSTATGLVH